MKVFDSSRCGVAQHGSFGTSHPSSSSMHKGAEGAATDPHLTHSYTFDDTGMDVGCPSAGPSCTAAAFRIEVREKGERRGRDPERIQRELRSYGCSMGAVGSPVVALAVVPYVCVSVCVYG